MAESWEAGLERWVGAGLVESAAADRIRAWEAAHQAEPAGVRWPVRLAIALGGLLLCAGVLLFVAAHWDALAPSSRFALVLAAVAVFHLAGAFAADRSRALSATLHACGTVALGGGIFLAGQVFHLEEHWPGGVLLWALGAWIGWALLRDWPQALLAALLTPAWLAGKWSVAADRLRGGPVLAVGVLLLALVYFGALPGPGGTYTAPRRALVWTGGLALIPSVLLMVAVAHESPFGRGELPSTLLAVGWVVALGGPLVLAAVLRRPPPVALLAVGIWAALGPLLADRHGVIPYVWTAVLSLGVIAWGVVERRSERINLGVAGFALTILVFYFSSVMDRLGRSASLIGLGLLFLGGGWALEQARRRLVARASGSAA
jgi:uncharacterized membrane protein